MLQVLNRTLRLGVLLVPLAANAHGPQIQITATGGKIVTRSVFLDGPYGESLGAPTSAYVMSLLPAVPTSPLWHARPNTALVPDLLNPGALKPEFFSGPGLAFGAGQTFTEGTTLSLRFTQGLKLWDGDSFEDAGAEELRAYRGGNPAAPSASILTSDLGPSGPLSLPPVSYTAEGVESHATVRYNLLGAAPADGVYLTGLRIEASGGIDPPLPSDTFYFVLSKNAGAGALAAATASLGFPASAVQSLDVPEPATLAAASLSLAAVALGSRQRVARGRQG